MNKKLLQLMTLIHTKRIAELFILHFHFDYNYLIFVLYLL